MRGSSKIIDVIFIIILLIIGYGYLNADSSSVNQEYTLAEFNSIQMGMSYEEVSTVLGGSGTILSDVKVAGIRTTMYGWENKDISNLNVTIQNGEVVSKAQFGLK